MRESVLKLISKTTYLDNSYFKVILTQLQTFLDMVSSELYQQFTVDDIAQMCNLCDFKYSIDGIVFKNYTSNQDNWWHKDGDILNSGLFGYYPKEEDSSEYEDEEKYKTCLANFNNHLLDEFKSDWRKITPGISSDGELDKRHYHYVLDDDENKYIEDE